MPPSCGRVSSFSRCFERGQELIHLHVGELEGLLFTEAELGGLFKKIILLIFDRLLIHCLESRPCNILEFLKRILQLINTVNGALHCIFKRTNRTLKTLEEVCLHHADQEIFTVGLLEGADSARQGIILRFEFLFHEGRRLEEG